MLRSRLMKTLVFIAATSLVASCKLAVMVTSGGDVISASGTRNCAAGSICEFDVAADFNETFTAKPRPGYEFVQWRGSKKSTFLCADQTSPTCTYSLLGNANAAIIVAQTVFGYLKPEFREVGVDTDHDGLRNDLDGDDDGDSIPDGSDACPLDPTPDCNLDTDGDGTPDAVDTDDDGDGVDDAADECPLDNSPTCRDTDHDGTPNNFDTDDDGDKILDVNDACPLDANLLCGKGTAITAANTVIVNGRVWAQPDLFKGLTWDQINAECPNAVCITGHVLNGRTMTGWKWAAFSEVWDMFTYLGAAPYSASNVTQKQINSVWAPAYYAAGFRVTETASLPRKVTFAWTSNRTPASLPYGSTHFMMRLVDEVSTTVNDTINGAETATTTKFAAWFYKDDTDGDGTPNDVDDDDDGDNILDTADECPLNADLTCKDTDHDGISDDVDMDDDGDGVADTADECPLNRDVTCKDTDRDGTPNDVDDDDDGDHILDTADECPLDSRLDCVDTDRDGISNDVDTDDDNDLVLDGIDQCPLVGPNQDGFGCPVDPDADGDGVNNTSDQCPGTPIGVSVNAAGCATTQIDTDGDGVNDASDQCPGTSIGVSVNAAGCATTQIDTDGDGVNDTSDQCPGTPIGASVNAAGCATTQIDTDGDGVFDASDQCPNTPQGDMVDAQGCTVIVDTDTDGVPDFADNCPAVSNTDQSNFDGDSDGDACDADDDNDGLLDSVDSCPLQGPNMNGWGCPWPLSVLNDTGLIFGGNYPTGNNVGCFGATIAQQDCSHGRDATHNDNADGHAGFSYTKLASDGTLLPTSAVSWACVRDNVTGLVWENKTDDGGIHDKDNTYRWGGKTAQGTYGTRYPDWNVLVDGSNNSALCGYTDWRVPTRFELEGLVNLKGYYPAIDTGYFPSNNNGSAWAFSALPCGYNPDSAWLVSFNDGSSYCNRAIDGYGVRLVRSGQ